MRVRRARVVARALSVCAAVAALVALSPARGTQDPERDEWLQPERVMDAVGIRPGMVVGEAGAGTGYFTFKLAHRVGRTGKVYANDIDRESLEHLRNLCREEGIGNIDTVVGEVDDPLFPATGLRVVIMVYAFHEFSRPVALLRNLKKYLAPGGTVVVLEQDPEASGNHHFMKRDRVLQLFAESGYELAWEERFLDEHLLLVFRPSSAQ